MKKVILLAFYFIISVFIAYSVIADSSEVLRDEITKITHYAEDYETGNINYAQMVVYMAAVKNDIESALHKSYKENGEVVSVEQLKEILGDPTEMVFWAWVQKEQKETKLDHEVPGWRKIIFDGKKVQIMLEAWPQIAEKKDRNLLYYSTHLGINFKEPEKNEEFDLNIPEIIELAENFQKTSSEENAEILTKAAVDAETPIQSYLQKNGEKCVDLMNKIIGSQYKREEHEIVVDDIKILVVDDFESGARLEFCDSCEGVHINLNVYSFERNGFGGNEHENEEYGQYKSYTNEQFEDALSKALSDYKNVRNIREARSIEKRINALNRAWTEVSNDIHEEINKQMQARREARNNEGQQYNPQDDERDRRDIEQLSKDLQKKNYEEMKNFYINLFSSYEKKENHFIQTEYERRIVQQKEQFSNEICSNNVDDNNNNEVDCEENSCTGQICGSTIVKEMKEGQEVDVQKDLFCIEKKCQLREEQHEKISVCGNNLCEKDELDSCKQDCIVCKKYEPLQCDGSVIFKGNDKNGCPLEPICLQKSKTCNSDADCEQPLCGVASCVEGVCKTISIEQCRESECIAGQKEIIKCGENDLITRLCIDGIWRSIGQQCSSLQPEQNQSEQPPILDVREHHEFMQACSVKGDCRGQNNVCSNGQCVILHEIKSSTEQENPTGSEVINNAQQNKEEGGQENVVSQTVTGFLVKVKKLAGFSLLDFDTNDSEVNSSIEGGILNNSKNNSEPQMNQSQDQEKINQENHEQKNREPVDKRQDGEQNQPRQENREMGAFSLYGVCRTSKERSEGFVSYNGWGTPFDKIQKLKEKYYNKDNSEWCKSQFKSLIIQRRELESSLNEKFAAWFFEDYLANSADEWEKRSQGIYELYWRDVELSQEIAVNAQCVGEKFKPELINFEYNTQYGNLKFWETESTAEIQRAKGTVNIISPYMSLWIFPSKEFIKSEFKKAMENQAFPGSRNSIEDENEGVLEEKDKKKIKSNDKLIGKFNKFIKKYGTNDEVKISVRLVDPLTNDVLFNLYVLLDKDNIIQIKPMLPEAMPKEDIKIEINFDKLYSMIEGIQKDMKETDTQRPPWDNDFHPVEGIQKIENIIKIWVRIDNMISSAKVTPASAEYDIKNLVSTFIWEMVFHGQDNNIPEETLEKQANKDNLAAITGQAIAEY